jgi:hypothetical protein
VTLVEKAGDPMIRRDPLPVRASAGTVPRRSPKRIASVRIPAALRVCPPASKPRSRTATGCVSVTTSTRSYGTPLCSSMSIPERHACEPGMT